MNRKDKVKQLLRLMEDELEEILETEELEDLSAEDCVALSFEIAVDQIETSNAQTTLTPATIDRKQVMFALDEDTFFPLSEDYDEDKI